MTSATSASGCEFNGSIIWGNMAFLLAEFFYQFWFLILHVADGAETGCQVKWSANTDPSAAISVASFPQYPVSSIRELIQAQGQVAYGREY
jgi:hypothetical protein